MTSEFRRRRFIQITGFLDQPLVRLTAVRFREFWREPEAVFWFSSSRSLLAAGLGMRMSSCCPCGSSRRVRLRAEGAHVSQYAGEPGKIAASLMVCFFTASKLFRKR